MKMIHLPSYTRELLTLSRKYAVKMEFFLLAMRIVIYLGDLRASLLDENTKTVSALSEPVCIR